MGVYIIAEAGVNHNGSMDLAEQLVWAAARAGADAVKFQAFVADELATSDARRAQYQMRNTGSDESQRAMLRALELSEAEHVRLAACAAEAGIDFLSSAFDLESVRMLGRMRLAAWKIPSGEITDLPYLREVACRAAADGSRVILSTGMADLDEVAGAMTVIEAAGVSRDQVTILHCSSEYPASPDDVNLRGMMLLHEKFSTEVGYSDHTEGIAVPVVAVALGATVVEKHLTVDRALPGPDHAASLEPLEFAQMVDAIRVAERSLGTATKTPSAAELATREVVRKSIVAAKLIRRGEIIGDDALTTKRPGTGISPMLWDSVLGTLACRDFAPDEGIEL